MDFNSLPTEIKLLILSYLTQNELCVASKVSKEWCQLAGDAHLWQSLSICNCSRSPSRTLKIIDHCYLAKEIIFSGFDKWSWIPEVPERKYLRKFGFYFCDIEPENVSMMVKKIPKIESVEFVDDNYDDWVVDEILKWEKLERLNIKITRKNFDGNHALEHLAKVDAKDYPRLKKINLCFEGSIVDERFLAFSTSHAANVKFLSLKSSALLEYSSFESLRSYTSLLGLRLYNCEYMSNEDYAPIKSLTSLERLHISSKPSRKRIATSIAFENLFKDAKFPKLTEVYLKHCAINDNGLRYLIESCPNLKTLELNGCDNITNEGVKLIMKKFKQIEKLFLVGLKKLRIATVREFLENLENLKYLYARYCWKIRPRQLRRLRLKYPKLAITGPPPTLPRRNEFQIRF